MDISALSEWTTSVKYKKSLSQLGACLSFEVQNIDGAPRLSVGDHISLGSYFYGMVTDVQSETNRITYTAYDECYYLNKSKITIQFDETMTTSTAIQALCKKYSIKIGYLPLMSNPVETVFYAKPVSEIIRTLLTSEQDANGGEYYITSEGFGSVSIRRLGSLQAGLPSGDITDASMSASLDNVRNRVTLIVKDGDEYTVSETAADAGSIAKYGLLQEYITTSVDADKAVAYAQNRLNSLSALIDEGEITINDTWQPIAVGSRIAVTEPVTGLSGTYVVESVTLSQSEGVKTTSIGLKRYHTYTALKATVAEKSSSELEKVDMSRKGLISAAVKTSYTDTAHSINNVISYFEGLK